MGCPPTVAAHPSVFQCPPEQYWSSYKPGESSSHQPVAYRQRAYPAPEAYPRPLWTTPSGLLIAGLPVASSSAQCAPQRDLPHMSGLFPAPESSSISGIFPPSPSDTCSSTSTEAYPASAPEFVQVVCNAPLVAPVPLPYHSPTFLQFDLPDDDEDLSHPPYVSRPHKRKRDDQDDETESHCRITIKRQATEGLRSQWNPAWTYPSLQHHPFVPSGMMSMPVGVYPLRR